MKRYCTFVLIAALFVIAEVKTTGVFIGRRMDKQNIVRPCSGISFSLKKGGNSDTCYKVHEPGGHYAK